MREITVQNERENTGMRIINFRTLLFCALFLCLGIVFAYLRALYALSFWYLLLLLPCIALLCVLTFTHIQWKRICVSVALLILSFALGYTLFSAQITAFADTAVYEGAHTVYGRVVDRETDGESHVVTLDKLRIDGKEEEGKMTVYLPPADFENIALSDVLLIEGNVQTNTKLLGAYGFRAYAVEEDIRYTATGKRYAVLENRFHPFLWIRNRMEEAVYAGMDETPAAVTMALLTGDTGGIDEGLLDNVRRGGIAHIFAVSGLHIGALYAFCLWLMERIGLNRRPKFVRFIVVVAVLLSYGGVCGYTASVIRAIVMCLLLYVSKLTGLGSDGLERISAAAIVVLLLSPVALFTVGFQLSFAACYGIALLSRPLQKGMYGLGKWFGYAVLKRERKSFVLEKDNRPLDNTQRIARAVVSFLSVTIAAQIATTPIQIAAFSAFPVWSLLFNMLFVPLVGVLFPVLLLFVFIACLLPLSWSFVLLYVPNVVCSALLLPFETLVFSVVTAIRFPFSAACPYYAAATLTCGRWNVRKRILYAFALLFALLCVCALVLANV